MKILRPKKEYNRKFEKQKIVLKVIMNIAFFDFDETLTKKDSFMLFMKWISSGKKYLLGWVFVAYYFLLSAFYFISKQELKEKILTFYLGGMDQAEVKERARQFTEEVFPKILTRRAFQQLDFHKKASDKIVIVSASLDLWLSPWCESNNFDLLCSEAEIKDGRITGKLVGNNCKGEEKVNRIRDSYELSTYEKIYVYGDSKHDLPMLRLGTISYSKWKLIK